MRCPSCGDDYEQGIETCGSCGVALADDDAGDGGAAADGASDGAATPSAPTAGTPASTATTAVVGRFDPVLAEAVSEAVRDLGVEPLVSTGDIAVVTVPADHRDRLRAQLAVRYRLVLDRLDDDGFVALERYSGPLPGWLDAPDGAWVDRAGVLRVDVPEEEEIADDARRTLGPALIGLGIVLALLGWYAGGDLRTIGFVVSLPLVVFGLLLPR